MIRAVVLAILLTSPAVGSTQSLSDIRPADVHRLERFDQIAGAAFLKAFAKGAEGDLALLQKAMAGQPDIAFVPDLAGPWKCRTFQLGGQAGLAAFSKFDCVISLENGQYRFEKLTGSQRTRGTLGLRDGRALYLGVSFARGEEPPEYTALPPEFRGDYLIQPAVGVFERVDAKRARILFPAPIDESDFTVLELTR